MTPLVSLDEFREAHNRVRVHARETPLIASRTLSEQTNTSVRLKTETFQKTGSYKIRGPLNKLALLDEDQKRRGVICSSAGNHAQGVALAARLYGIDATVVMAENATPTKVAATKGYGAEVIQYGSIWDEANEFALGLAAERGFTYVHPFDDQQLMAGQGTVGLEIADAWPDVEVVIVPIGGGGLISGVSMALKQLKPSIRIVGVESAGAPAMKRSVEKQERVRLENVASVVDGLRVRQIGELTLSVVSEFVDEIVLVPEEAIFDAVLWTMSRTKLVAEGAAAATVAALLTRAVDLPANTNVACVLSGGNVEIEDLRGRPWN